MDLLATTTNKNRINFCSRGGQGPQSLGDAFLLPWTKSILHAYLPTLFLSKTKQDNGRTILVVPTWLRQVWYPNLIHLASYLVLSLLSILYLLSQDSLGLFIPT